MEEAENILCAVEQSDDTKTDENMGERGRVGDKMQARQPGTLFSQGNRTVEALTTVLLLLQCR